MASVLDVIRGISHVVAQKGYDGALDEKGEPVKIGLKREQGDPLIDTRIVDGFGVRFSGDNLIITYQSEERIKDIHRIGPAKYEQELEQTFKDISNFLKKEYNKLGKGKLQLKELGDVDALIQNMSNVRTWVTACKTYKIQGLDGVEQVELKEKLNFTN